MSENKTVKLFCAVANDELQLIIKSGMKCFPPRHLSELIFKPVLSVEYAKEIANNKSISGSFINSDWHVLEFEMPESFVTQFQVKIIGASHRRELWVPSEQMVEFNTMIIGSISVVKPADDSTIINKKTYYRFSA